MSKVFNRSIKVGGESRVINGVTVNVLEYDGDNNVLRCSGTSVPTGAGYAKGALFIKTNAASGTKGLYENQGTTAAASFNVVGDVAAAEIALAEGSLLVGNSAGAAAALDAKGNAKILVGNGTTVASVSVNGDATLSNAGALTIAADAVDGTKLADNAVSLEHLDDGVLPSHVVKFGGKHTTAGGDVNEQASVAGVVPTDIVIASVEDDGTNNVTLLTATAGTDVVDFVLSGDPSTDAVISYVVFRIAA